MKISNCRNCGKKNLIKLFTLGNQYFTGKFIKHGDKVKKAPINLSICKKCKLVQLKDRYNLKYMYGPDYGYRTGINKTISLHVKKITKILSKEGKVLAEASSTTSKSKSKVEKKAEPKKVLKK